MDSAFYSVRDVVQQQYYNSTCLCVLPRWILAVRFLDDSPLCQFTLTSLVTGYKDQLLFACGQIKGKHDKYNSIPSRFFCLTTVCQVLILCHCLKRNKVITNNILVARAGKPSIKIRWTDRVKNEEILQRVNEERNILQVMKRDRATWIGHISRRNCFPKKHCWRKG